MPEPRSSHHVLLYGPPATGKLTVARALGARYGLRVLDNHLSVDPALRLFDFGTPDFFELIERLRVDMLGAAARAGISVASTFVYNHLVDDAHVATLVAASADAGATVTRVQLLPSDASLAARVAQPSRQGTNKLHDPDVVARLMAESELRQPVHPDDLTIDNTDLSPDDTADRIAAHVGLAPCPTS